MVGRGCSGPDAASMFTSAIAVATIDGMEIGPRWSPYQPISASLPKQPTCVPHFDLPILLLQQRRQRAPQLATHIK